ncbi:MAG: hypothetical protein MHM6MM_000047 [Cercozoa sp. M6MM]
MQILFADTRVSSVNVSTITVDNATNVTTVTGTCVADNSSVSFACDTIQSTEWQLVSSACMCPCLASDGVSLLDVCTKPAFACACAPDTYGPRCQNKACSASRQFGNDVRFEVALASPSDNAIEVVVPCSIGATATEPGFRVYRCNGTTGVYESTSPSAVCPCYCDAVNSTRIVPPLLRSAECDAADGNCNCRKGFSGPRCENEILCTSDSDCQDSFVPDGVVRCASNRCACVMANRNFPLCDVCRNGTRLGTMQNCVPCGCNDNGAINGSSTMCNPVTGQCDCKTGFEGLQCERQLGALTCPFFEEIINGVRTRLECGGSTRGNCDRSVGRCACISGWSGSDCGTPPTPCSTKNPGDGCTPMTGSSATGLCARGDEGDICFVENVDGAARLRADFGSREAFSSLSPDEQLRLRNQVQQSLSRSFLTQRVSLFAVRDWRLGGDFFIVINPSGSSTASTTSTTEVLSMLEDQNSAARRDLRTVLRAGTQKQAEITEVDTTVSFVELAALDAGRGTGIILSDRNDTPVTVMILVSLTFVLVVLLIGGLLFQHFGFITPSATVERWKRLKKAKKSSKGAETSTSF